ncbi:molecular chaperone DnaK [Methylomarinovum caldicuralii]|uniref:Molecular chaperone DnaK n=1 Tax=Methylomarinovum caldicuralii TaxID=438856 RepID=A0AAU9BPU8_9GAMM|nr:Hsp70 family protein [Methylomarinovum caldicuralii]BCX80748.1 molecular chaperone DnaK [Methylomarinovum caldicuralii]
MTDIIGIDLGTTNSEVAVLENGRPKVLTDAAGNALLPSVVGIDDQGRLLVGEPARNQHPLYPERTVKSVKRHMGSDTRFHLGGQDYTPQEISAILLRTLKQRAEDHLGRPVTRAVVTVPAYFNDAQRQATREAGEIAGLTVERLLNEPTAAALVYESDLDRPRQVLVYDLGGGTFDVSIVRIQHGVVEVIASHGDNRLGGDDFDRELVELLAERIQQESGVDVRNDRRIMVRLLRVAVTAKHALSERPFVAIREEFLFERDGTPWHLHTEVARDEYEALIAPYLDRTLEAVHTVLKSAGLGSGDIEEVLLVGGATRTPLVSERLEAVLGQTPKATVDPDLCVAMGAAVQAGMLAGETVASVLVDVTPYTFGTGALGELDGRPHPNVFVPLIRKHTPLPASKSEVFYTVRDGQTRVDVRVYQGEDPEADNNTLVGEFSVEGLRGVADDPVVLRFDLDTDGILQVTATEKATGLEKSVRIERAVPPLDRRALGAARERVAGLLGETAARPYAQTLLARAERLLPQLEGENREDLETLSQALREALEAGDEQAVSRAEAALEDLLYYLES